MKILVVGGGSGGHITPAVAVIREILKEKPRSRVEFWTDFKYYKNVTKLTTEIGVAW
ncbi:glycosyltransferase, partial [Candidatus Saccharibacteria bacterium]|nr:glycosyltransferase [Candidatus Saccharibacteria bacterium]